MVLPSPSLIVELTAAMYTIRPSDGIESRIVCDHCHKVVKEIGVEVPGVFSIEIYLTKNGGPGSDRYDDARGRAGAWGSDNRVRTILCSSAISRTIMPILTRPRIF
jgi:hypothetical protein